MVDLAGVVEKVVEPVAIRPEMTCADSRASAGTPTGSAAEARMAVML